MIAKLKLIILLTSAFILSGCDSGGLFNCEHSIELSTPSPDGELVAALDEVGCGATTGFVTWVLIAPATEKLDPKKHKFAVFEGRLHSIEWIKERELRVEGDAKLFSIEKTYNVKITR